MTQRVTGSLVITQLLYRSKEGTSRIHIFWRVNKKYSGFFFFTQLLSFFFFLTQLFCFCRQLLVSHRTGLLEQLSACLDPALCLHLATLLLFHSVTGHILHASGKFVPHLITHLKQHLPLEMNQILMEYQGQSVGGKSLFTFFFFFFFK